MRDEASIGTQIRRIRHEALLTQEQLAERAGVSVDLVRKLEQDRRGSARVASLMALARALDVELSDLVGTKPRLDPSEDGRVLALRDALLSPDMMAGIDRDRSQEPPALGAVEPEIVRGWANYWTGQFTPLAAALPSVIADARDSYAAEGTAASVTLSRAYQLSACLLVHLGRTDLAAVASERAAHAALSGNDELQWATVHDTYVWVLHRQGRVREAETHAMSVAERIEPNLRIAPLEQLTVYGGLVLRALGAASAAGRKDEATTYIGLARMTAGRFEHGDRHDYEISFGPTQVASQATHAYAQLQEPTRALRAASAVERHDLLDLYWGRHLLDVAQAQIDANDVAGAERSLLRAEAFSPEWFRLQGLARSLVGGLVHDRRRLSPGLRRLTRSARLD
jgi:transcriptional regulator with XRE-family HTH domain